MHVCLLIAHVFLIAEFSVTLQPYSRVAGLFKYNHSLKDTEEIWDHIRDSGNSKQKLIEIALKVQLWDNRQGPRL